MRSLLFLALSQAVALSSASPSKDGWAFNEALQARTTSNITQHPAKLYTLNLDLPQQERWNEIAADFKDQAYLLSDYLKDNLPSWAYPIAVKIGGEIEPYFKMYGDEMIGLATALDLDLGVIVALNLVYQLERIGVNCSNWNNTGPTLSDDAIPRGLSCNPDGVPPTAEQLQEEQALNARREANKQTGPEGLCTSIVSQSSSGSMLHGRNLDWNIPESLKTFVVDFAVYRGGKLLYYGTGAVGFVGMLNGLRVGSDPSQSWSVSQDARHHGGRIPFNLMEALKTGALTPEQALRYSLERNTTSASDSDAAGANTKAGNKDDEQGGFDGAVSFLSEVDIVDDVYYVMAGGGAANVEGQTPPGAVITRQRNGARDVWRVGVDAATTPHGPELPQSPNWWLTETNYDHWESPPAADNRRDPANALMEALGGANATDPEALFGVMSTWPVFNPHTTFTTMIDFATGAYNSTIWFGNSP